jgi:hypothetical protein
MMKTELTKDQIECLRIWSHSANIRRCARAFYVKPDFFKAYFAEALAIVVKEMQWDDVDYLATRKGKKDIVNRFLEQLFPPPWQR